jgi:hypothetical protein
MDPKEYVVALKKESLRAVDQKDDASSGTNHQDPITPATVT